MKTVLVHLSDIHIVDGNNPIWEKVERLAGVIQSHCDNGSECVIVLSGDIAYSGGELQYKQADKLLQHIKNKVNDGKKISIHYIMVPGNHDCNFTTSDTVRDALLLSVKHSPSTVSEEVINAISSVQRHYNSFVENTADIKPTGLITRRIVDANGIKILFNIINTSWMSVKSEKAGTLYFPIDALADMGTQHDLAVTVFHHPYSWLEQVNAKQFRNRIEQVSDVILTGHEHEASSYSKYGYDTSNEYIEGGVLQETGRPATSSFNIVTIDSKEKTFLVESYQWSDDHYKKSKNVQPAKFTRNKYILRNTFQTTKTHEDWLMDAGASFTHRKAARITHEDLFVYPDCREYRTSGKSSRLTYTTVHSEKLLEHILKSKHALIIGHERSGKTTLAKALYKSFSKQGLVTIYISGSHLSHCEDALQGVVDAAFRAQYGGELTEKYNQLLVGQKAVIVDNFHYFKCNSDGQNRVISFLLNNFGTSIILGTELVKLSSINESTDSFRLFTDYKHYEILEFGYRLRDVLIEKWMKLGDEYSLSPAELTKEVSKCQKIINTIVGKNLVPSYPIFLLIILQQYEASVPFSTDSGSYGYFYEMLITRSLASVWKKRADVDMAYNYLSEMAFEFFTTNIDHFSSNQMNQFHAEYCKTYRIRRNFDRFVDEMVASHILTLSNSTYSFRYPYLYYYFIAKHISSHLNSPETRETIKQLCECIHTEVNANILIFLSYMTKDEYIVNTVLEKAQSIFQDHAPCDLNEHVKSINTMYDKLPTLVLLDTDPIENRKKALEFSDELAQLDNVDCDDTIVEEAENQLDVDDLLKINVANKTIEVIGQILKNRAGSLVGETKFKMAKECYMLGLRATNSIIQIIDNNIEELVKHLAEAASRLSKSKTDREYLLRQAKEFIFLTAEIFSLVMVKKVSHSVGSEDLVETYDEVAESCGSTAVSLIDLSIKIDHLEPFPEREILDLYKQVRGNPLAEILLKHLVMIHFHLMPTDFRLRQRVCSRLGIQVKSLAVIDESIRKIK